MDLRDRLRPIITILVGIGVVILLIVVIVKLFSGGGGKTARTIDLTKYSDTASVASVLIDDPTQIDQAHSQVKITVSQTQNEIDIIQGYQGNVTQSRTYPSNSSAYGAFLASLQLMGFTKASVLVDTQQDYRGFCPTGERYVFTFNDGSREVINTWAVSCGSQGTYRGNKSATLDLFSRQIPEHDFETLTSNIPLGF
jgi:hypothetical protein